MKLLALMGAVAVVLVGCGDAGTNAGSDAGADASVVCRAPSGCFARIENGGCVYGCAVPEGGTQVPVVCVHLPDGGAADQSDFSPAFSVPLALAQSAMPYAADLNRDPQNCTRCGRRCAAGEVCGRAPAALTVDCYRP